MSLVEPACDTLQRRFVAASEDGPWAAVAVLADEVRRRIALHFPHALRGRLDPEDLAQDVLLKLFRAVQRGTLTRSSAIDAYVWLTCRNACRDAWRRHCMEQAHAVRARPERDAAASPLESVIRAEDTELLDRAIGKLGERERELLGARFAGESFPAIGARCGQTPDAPRKLLPRILARLRAMLADPRLGRAIAVVDPVGWQRDA